MVKNGKAVWGSGRSVSGVKRKNSRSFWEKHPDFPWFISIATLAIVIVKEILEGA